MAKKSSIEKEKRRRLLIDKYALKRKQIKLDFHLSTSFLDKVKQLSFYQGLPRNSSLSRLV